MQDLTGKTAFVTGAGNGIGLGIARALARRGVQLALADIEAPSLEQARRDRGARGAGAGAAARRLRRGCG